MIGNALRPFPLFVEFRDWELERLQEMMTSRQMAAGTDFIQQGSLVGAQDANAFIVVAGDVRTLRVDDRGQVLTEVVLGPGSILGILALILDHKRTASCTTATAAPLLEVDRARFDAMFESDNRVAVKSRHVVARQFAQDLRQANVAAARRVDS